MNFKTYAHVLLGASLSFIITACADDGVGSTQTSPPPTTTSNTLDPSTPSSSGGEETTTTDSTSEPTTGSSATTTDDATGEPVDEPTYCVPSDPADMVECAPGHRMWCDEAVALAESTGMPQQYVDIVKLKCEQGDEACGVCFYIENTCDSLIGDSTCDDVMLTCGCLAVAHEVL